MRNTEMYRIKDISIDNFITNFCKAVYIIVAKQLISERKSNVSTQLIALCTIKKIFEREQPFGNNYILHEFEKLGWSYFINIFDKIYENSIIDYPDAISNAILNNQIDRCLHFDKEDDKPKRGRPIVKQLCEKISDSNVVKVARKCYLNIYRKALKFAQNITQYLVCFLYSLFDIPDNNTETVYGKVGHFHRIMSSVKGLKIPSVRRLQQMLKWFMEWKEAVIKTAKEMKEEITHRAWEELVEKIKRQFEILIPQYAMC